MLSRQYRLRHRRDIHRVHKRGRRARTPLFSVKSLPNRQPHPRIGIAVSTKINKRAVKRNRMRRRLFGLVQQLLGQLEPYDIFISVHQDISDTPSDDIREQLLKALSHLDVFKSQ